MANQEPGTYSQFLDEWETFLSPPPLREQLDDLLIHVASQRVMTPDARATQIEDFRSLMSYRHIFS